MIRNKYFLSLSLPVYCLLALGFFLLPNSLRAQDKSRMAIIPQPESLKVKKGSFPVTPKTVIVIGKEDSASYRIGELLSGSLSRLTGFRVPVVFSAEGRNSFNQIRFRLSSRSVTGKEGYFMKVGRSGISIQYDDQSGAFYALQTLLQLMPEQVYGNSAVSGLPLRIPCCEIQDKPRYTYRGMHLDVSRHFFPVDFIKRYIDLLAMHKFNTFHWHLTDDQGWRIMINKYPLLTETGSRRKETMKGSYDDHRFDGIPYEGFYSQEEIREVVRYAQERYVTIIPEIEMPGHARAALAAYPELACTTEPVEVATAWGVFTEAFCPSEVTFSFLEDVLMEVCSLFPGKYVHIGGDECLKDTWKSSAHCQELMVREKLQSVEELQSYFIRRIERFLSAQNKKLIGWDEILEGGLAPEATVMSWRGIDGGLAAARQNHDVIMTPGSHCYFDHYQSDPATEPLAIGGYTTLEKVYAYEPTPADSLTPDQQRHILGAQGNVWTEYIPDGSQVEYMAFPRACALAEVLWSPAETRNWKNFTERLLIHFRRLDALQVRYARSVFDVTSAVHADPKTRKLLVYLSSGFEGGQIHYTLDGSDPDAASPVFSEPIPITQSTGVRACLNYQNRRGKILSRELHVHRATALPYSLKDQWKQYDGSTAFGLTDGIYGEINRYNTWVGFSGRDLDATVDLEKIQTIRRLSVSFYNKNRSWIFLPVRVSFFLSSDSIHWQKIYETSAINDTLANSIVPVTLLVDHMEARYIRVVAQNTGRCPHGHPGEGKEAWLFADEIVVE